MKISRLEFLKINFTLIPETFQRIASCPEKYETHALFIQQSHFIV